MPMITFLYACALLPLRHGPSPVSKFNFCSSKVLMIFVLEWCLSVRFYSKHLHLKNSKSPFTAPKILSSVPSIGFLVVFFPFLKLVVSSSQFIWLCFSAPFLGSHFHWTKWDLLPSKYTSARILWLAWAKPVNSITNILVLKGLSNFFPLQNTWNFPVKCMRGNLWNNNFGITYLWEIFPCI